MPNESFKPISIELHGTGKCRTISSVFDASDCLLQHWPEAKQHSNAFVAALLACQDAIDGVGTPQAVRDAVVEAAAEADILVVRG
jgi:hypothetical protein